MAIKPDFSNQSRDSDALVALALAFALLHKSHVGGTLGAALQSIPESSNAQLKEARTRLQAMIAQLESPGGGTL